MADKDEWRTRAKTVDGRRQMLFQLALGVLVRGPSRTGQRAAYPREGHAVNQNAPAMQANPFPIQVGVNFRVVAIAGDGQNVGVVLTHRIHNGTGVFAAAKVGQVPCQQDNPG